jgi:hypothetical protein
MFSIYLHGNWRWLTRNMTTPQKEAAADAVERHGLKHHNEPDEPWTAPEHLRWWREGDTVICKMCLNPCNAQTAHLHQGQFIGDECCWDERLRSSE